MNAPEIESLLRAAPRPVPPPDLHQRLVDQVRLHPVPGTMNPPLAEDGWLRRWWPTLLVGGGVLACAATLLIQQGEIRELQARLAAQSPNPGGALVVPDIAVAPGASGSVLAAADGRSEILRLRTELATLQVGSSTAGTLTAENRQLENQLASQSGLSAEDLAALEEARARAKSIECVNGMKNLGLALRIWATDHQDLFPMDLLVMTGELRTPKNLVCPSDTRHPPPTDWASFTPGQVSYEFLTPGGTESEPQCVAARCPIHRHLLLSDGSVQMSRGDGSNLISRLTTRNGKLYLE